MAAKRLFDLFFVTLGLILLSPIMVFIVVWVRLSSPGPALFKQERIGRGGRPFFVLKFRTMIQDAESNGGKITIGADPRITKSGKFLRKYKLDELPQLLNVLKGEMSLVGPRPEVPEYVAIYPEDVRKKVLSVPPGITDFAAIEYRDENALLARASDPEREYVEKVLPEKLDYYLEYVEKRSIWLDFTLIIRTLWAIMD
ncbi:MAG: sugar transferase [Gammaproteobacteria bacterium]|nr:sugar transferase [Gammaproteobacteria bacterium]